MSIISFARLDSLELQELVCDIAQACAVHNFHEFYKLDDYDEPLFTKTFDSTYHATFDFLTSDYDGSGCEDFPF